MSLLLHFVPAALLPKILNFSEERALSLFFLLGLQHFRRLKSVDKTKRKKKQQKTDARKNSKFDNCKLQFKALIHKLENEIQRRYKAFLSLWYQIDSNFYPSFT